MLNAVELKYYKPKPGGTSKGGIYKDKDGSEWLVKEYNSGEQAKNEYLAYRFYKLAGIDTPDYKLMESNGKYSIGSKMIKLSNIPKSDYPKLWPGFALDAWLANWDVIGADHDNVMKGSDDTVYRVDLGGSLLYRAMGGKKTLTNDVIELDTMRNKSTNINAWNVFNDISDDILFAGIKNVLTKITLSKIDKLVGKYGPGDNIENNKLKQILKSRLQHYKELTKEGKTTNTQKGKLPSCQLPDTKELVCNPFTNNLVKRTGNIGKWLMVQKGELPEKTCKTSIDGAYPANTFVCNNVTGKYVMKTGDIGTLIVLQQKWLNGELAQTTTSKKPSIQLPISAKPHEYHPESAIHMKPNKYTDMFKVQTNYVKNLDKETIDAIKYYTGSGYTTMNNLLRQNKMQFKTNDIVNKINLIDQAFRNVPPLDQSVVVYRGINLDYKLNQDFVDKGYVSTSADKNKSLAFNAHKKNKCCFFEIYLPKGSRVLPLVSISHYKVEMEILLCRNSLFQIVKQDFTPTGNTIITKYIENIPTTPFEMTPVKIDQENWKMISDTILQDENGCNWFITNYNGNIDRMKNEYLGYVLYLLNEILVKQRKLVHIGDQLYIATKNMQNLIAPIPTPQDYSKFWPGFIIDCWLANWNVVGDGMTNIKMDNGKATRMDVSGVMKYRAIGQHKPFTSDVTEINSLLNPSINKDATAVFGNITETAWKKSADKLKSIEDSKLLTYVNTFGPGSEGEKTKLFEILVARKNKLLAYKFPETKAKSPVKTKSKSPVKTKSKSPVKTKSKSPVKIKSKSPVKTKSKSPVKIKSKSPVKTKSKSPVNYFNQEDHKMLANMKLTKIPEDLKKSASKIKRLFLQNNKLTEIPDWIDVFTNLEILNVAFNPLKKLPNSIGNLQKLTILNISQTELTSLPESMKKLTNLKYIYYKKHTVEKVVNIDKSVDLLNNILSNVVDKDKQSKTKCKLNDEKYLKNPDLYICNEKTGNWVKKHGEVGQAILKSQKPNKPVNPAQSKTKCKLDDEKYLKNPNLYICNEKTGNWVKKHGEVGQAILNQK
jgi:hypothetical protein